ncbi:MAG: DNA polymerase III subunit delta [Phycisphaeraceae bacterium]
MAKRTSTRSSGHEVTPGADWRVCVLTGPDEMIKRLKLDELRSALEQEHGEFETMYYDGETVGLADVLDELRTYSMLQSFKVVVVDKAEKFAQRFREPLERYAAAPADSGTLVLRCDTWNKGNLDKAIAKVGGLIDCKPMKPSEVPAWVIRRAQEEHGCPITPQAAAALAQRMGSDLMRLDSELAKLAVMVDKGQGIDVPQVEAVVGRSSDEKAWEIKNALLAGLARGKGVAGPQARETIEKLHELVDVARQDEVPIHYAIADLMRQLFYASTLLRRRAGNDFAIAKQVGFWGDSRAFMDVARRIDPAKARRWLDRIMDGELRVRSSLGDSLRNLECFCAVVADEG